MRLERAFAGCLAVIASLPFAAAFDAPAAATTLTVTTTSDAVSFDGACSLREALIAAGLDLAIGDCPAGEIAQDSIAFSLGAGVPLLQVGQAAGLALPDLRGALSIDGATGGATRVRLNGLADPAGAHGLLVTEGTATIRNVEITSFEGDGIRVRAAATATIQGSRIGTTGTDDLGNGVEGVHLMGSGSVVGGSGAGQGNVISGNGGDGVEIDDDDGAPTNDNVVRGNLVGVGSDGTTRLANGSNGVAVLSGEGNTVGGSAGTTPGGSCTGACNVLSGNSFDGISIAPTSAIPPVGTRVLGNHIGTDRAGNAAVRNSFEGINVNGPAHDTTIGGTTAAEGNLISGNGSDGVAIEGSTATGNVLLGNRIGTTTGGASALGNTANGVLVGGAPGNTVGGAVAGARNVISRNGGHGVEITGAGADGNVVAGNFIGVDLAGTADAGNFSDGVRVENAARGNAIGGDGGGAGNVISGNGNDGVELNGAGTVGNRVEGNRVGTDAAGTGRIDNGGNGIRVTAVASLNTIGGDSAAAENLVLGNVAGAIVVSGDGTDGNVVARNRGGATTPLFLDLEPSPGLGNDPMIGPAGGTQPPALTAAGASAAAGTAAPGAVVRLFRSATVAGSPPKDVAAFLASATAGADGRWRATYATPVAEGVGVAATQTGAAGTSEMTAVVASETVAPDTTITGGPGDGATIGDAAPTFSFASDDLAATFECSVDGGAFAACASPRRLAALADGPHTFAVRAVDANLNPDPLPATRSFAVAGAGAQADRTAPLLRAFALTNRTFRRGAQATPLASAAARRARRPPRGTTFSFHSSEAAAASLAFERELRGRRVGGRCLPDTRARRERRRCTRYTRAGALTRTIRAGTARVPFSGRLGRRALRLGAYRVSLSARDGAGNTSRVLRARFRIVR